jgi:general secretion pathway protein K
VSCHRPHPSSRSQRGAALLVAMLIVTLVTTLAASMIWQQYRGIEVEGAERARSQSIWLLDGALDWARLILREDGREGGSDALTEPWAAGLAEIRLSTFLSADKNNTQDSSLNAFLSGGITDAQGRFNLRNLVSDDTTTAETALAILQRLCDELGLPESLASQIAEAMASAHDAQSLSRSGQKMQDGAPVALQRVEQLRWLGVDPVTVAKLAPFVVILPERTKVNVNTAPAEVLMAVVSGLDAASAQRLVKGRMTLQKGFESLSDAQDVLPSTITLDSSLLSINTHYFLVTGQLRYDDFILQEESLVQRSGLNVSVLWRDRTTDSSPT